MLAEVGAGWVDAAIDHGAPELARPDDKRVLWESIDGDEMRELWQLVVRHVRSEQSPNAGSSTAGVGSAVTPTDARMAPTVPSHR